MRILKKATFVAAIYAAGITAACTTRSDDAASVQSQFARPSDGARFLVGFYSESFVKAAPYNGEVFEGSPLRRTEQ
jgi:hypothetical protein